MAASSPHHSNLRTKVKIMDSHFNQQPQVSLPFLSLPAELRNQIYQLVLPDYIDIAEIRHTRIPLLQVSRQTYQECLAILYHRAQFAIDLTEPGNYATFLEWIYALKPWELASIMHLRLMSTLRLWSWEHESYDAKFCFEFHANTKLSTFDVMFHMSKTDCDERPCTGPFSLTQVPLTRSIGAALGVEEVSPGDLTSGHILAWVRATLTLASYNVEWVDDQLLKPCWRCGKSAIVFNRTCGAEVVFHD